MNKEVDRLMINAICGLGAIAVFTAVRDTVIESCSCALCGEFVGLVDEFPACCDECKEKENGMGN